jgi:hypothetical protein
MRIDEGEVYKTVYQDYALYVITEASVNYSDAVDYFMSDDVCMCYLSGGVLHKLRFRSKKALSLGALAKG